MKLINQYSQYQDIYNKGYRFNPEEETFFTSDSKKFTLPEGFEDWKIKTFKREEYLNARLEELGIKPKNHPKIELIDMDGSRATMSIFTANKDGDIEILLYGLKRQVIVYDKKTTSAGTKQEYCVQKRLNPQYASILHPDGKYDFSEGKNAPFWHPVLVEAFENQTPINTLVITEGQFKAFKACEDGIYTIGLTSISHFRDKKMQTLHPEILEFIKVCEVKNVVILWDGDCRSISTKHLDQEKDLSERPNLFYVFATKIADMVHDFFPNKRKMQVYFATIKSDELDYHPKGIDDLLIEHKQEKKQIVEDFGRIGVLPSNFIYWFPISETDGRTKMRKFFNLQSVQQFYGFHSEKIRGKSFIFQGSNYRVENGLPIIEIPKDLKTYKRIGTDYYQLQMKPVPKTGVSEIDRLYEEVLVPWTLPAIKSDHGKDVDRHIERYKGFTNEANHVDYQQVIDGYWNLYANIKHEVVKGNFPHIEKLLKHLFQEHFDNEMIYDYFSILYRYPWQKLPVVCLVSKEQATGKSTFIYLMKLIFKQNMAIISNNDLTADFNSHWTSKLVVASEETLLEKKDGYEKIKSLTTAKEIMRNEKNKTASSIPCMVHFVFCSNHEDDFIKIDDYDSRLWIRKVTTITEKIKKFDQKIEEEVPYFVEFIMNREIKYEDVGERLYFHPRDFRTEAFHNIVKHSEPGVIKDLRIRLEDYFYKFHATELKCTVSDLKQYFGAKGDDFYLNKILRQYFNVEKTANAGRYGFLMDNFSNPDEPGNVKGKGRYFTFLREQFVNQEETKSDPVNDNQTTIFDELNNE